MAKLIKQISISSETVTLGEQPSSLSDTNEPTPLESIQLNEVYLEELREQAFKEGFISGKKEGQLDVEQQINQIKKQLETLLLSIPEAINQHRLDLHTEIADIVLLIIQSYFIEQQGDHQALQSQINQILNQLNSQQSTELYLHPDAIKALQTASLKLEATHLNNLKIKADDSLILGGCLVKTEHGIFDASIETRIERLKQLLLKMKQGERYALLD